MPDRFRGRGRQLYRTTRHARWHGIYACHRATIVPVDATVVALFVAWVDHRRDGNTQLLHKSSAQCRKSPVRRDAGDQVLGRTTHQKELRWRGGRGSRLLAYRAESG